MIKVKLIKFNNKQELFSINYNVNKKLGKQVNPENQRLSKWKKNPFIDEPIKWK